MGNYVVLAINPGSTSDEIALFKGTEKLFHKVVRYTPKELAPFDGQKVTSQYDFRRQLVLKTLEEHGTSVESIDAIVGRGGLVKPIPSGTYAINNALINDLKEGVMGDHPSNLGGLIAHSIAAPLNKPSFIADPVVVDELDTIARYSGMPENPRVSIFHALNQKRVARQIAKQLGKKYEDARLIVCHAGGGISVGAHRDGRVVDVNNALDGDGPFTPQRSGGVPAGGLAKMCYSGKFAHPEIKLKLKGKGGVVAYTGTSDMVMLGKFIRGEELTADERSQLLPDLTPAKAREVVDALAYQLAKEICSMAAVLHGKVDGIVFTGGLAYQADLVVNPVRERTEWIAPLFVLPGGDEMSALHEAALRVLANEDTPAVYR